MSWGDPIPPSYCHVSPCWWTFTMHTILYCIVLDFNVRLIFIHFIPKFNALLVWNSIKSSLFVWSFWAALNINLNINFIVQKEHFLIYIKWREDYFSSFFTFKNKDLMNSDNSFFFWIHLMFKQMLSRNTYIWEILSVQSIKEI